MDAAASYISSSDLRNHSTRDDAWISIDGAVYDVTEWLHRHPGGSLPLLTLAGRDATDAFLAFHPPSVALLLPRLSTNLRLCDHAVSPASSDYPQLLSELSGAGLFERKGHTTVTLLSVILPLLVLSVAGVVLSERASVHALSGALMGLAWIQSGWIGHDSAASPEFLFHALAPGDYARNFPLRDGCAFELPPVHFRRGGQPVSSPVAPLRVRCAHRSSLPWCPSGGATFPHGATLPGSVTEATGATTRER